jgi:hypothetical protein
MTERATVTVVLKPDIVSGLRSGAPDERGQQILDAVQARDSRLEPMYPGVEDPSLSVYYEAHSPDAERATQLGRELLGLAGVDGAYITPETELP